MGRGDVSSFLGEEWFAQYAIVENGRLVCVSGEFTQLFGYSREELPGTEVTRLLAAEDTPFLSSGFHHHDADGSSRVETRGVRKDGATIYVELLANRSFYQGREMVVITSFADITEQKMEEKAGLELEERFRAAFRYAAIGMALVGINGRMIDINYALCDILGYDEEEWMGMSFHDCLSSEELERYWESCTSLLIGENVYAELEVKLYHKSGTTVWGHLNATLVRDEDGKPLYYILQLQNVTKRKEAEELLRKSDKLNAVGQLAAGVAHEVRNPLTVLKGFTKMLQKRDGPNGEYYQVMLSEVERIEAIINEFLGLAKPQKALFSKNDLVAILQDVEALMQTKAIMNNVVITTELEHPVIPATCDSNQLKQVLINIMQNAIEAMPNGGNLQLEAKYGGTQDEVVIRVTDQGCGISEERIARLGEPFYSSKEKGTGLGLMVSYQIIQKHSGRIEVKSQPNVGTQFEITLPVLPPVDHAD